MVSASGIWSGQWHDGELEVLPWRKMYSELYQESQGGWEAW